MQVKLRFYGRVGNFINFFFKAHEFLYKYYQIFETNPADEILLKYILRNFQYK